MKKPSQASSTLDPTKRRSLLEKVFISPTEPRLRAGWRLLLQTLLQVVATILIGIVVYAFAAILLDEAEGAASRGGLLLTQAADLLAVTASIYVARRWLDRRSFVSLGLQIERVAAIDFAVGIAVTLLMMGTIFLLEWALGWLHVEGFAWRQDAATTVIGNVVFYVVICLVVAWKEELMSRGYHLQNIASGTNLAWGWFLSSAIFGVLHLANPHANLMAVAGIIFAGLFLGYAYIRTGRLWLAMGLHTGWNFFEGVVFGFPVSGLSFYALPRVSVRGPELWTGGAFGPEAGLVLAPALLIGFVLLHLYGNRRRNFAKT